MISQMRASKVASTNKGFTLIEILVSFSIIAIITGLLYGTFRSTIESAEALDKNADSYRIARIVFYQVTKDLTMLTQTVPVLGGASSSGLGPAFGTRELVGENRSRYIDGGNYPNDTISFLSLSAPPVIAGFPVLERAEITYALSEASLLRNTKLRDIPVKNEVGESILGLNLRYYNGIKKEWLDEWDSRVTTGIPLAIEITLIVKAAPPFKEKTFRTTVGTLLS